MTLVFYWWAFSPLQSRVMVEAADTWHRSLTESSCFYRPCTVYQPQLVLVPWKHANLSVWLFWPQAIDYTPSRLECHWNTGGDQILHPGSALIPHRFNQTHLFPPPLSAVWKMGSDCCCGFSKQKWTCFYYKLGQSGIHFISKFLSQWVCEDFFFCVSDNAIGRGGRRLLLCYPLLLNIPFIHVHFMAVTTAVEGLSIVEPHCTLQGGSSLACQSFDIFFILFSEQGSRG